MEEWTDCPEGMYPVDSDFPDDYENFAALKEYADRMSDCLNFPISWFMRDRLSNFEVEWNNDNPNDLIELEQYFSLVFYMPRKSKTWSLTTTDFNADEVKAWLKEWIPTQLSNWYGFNLKDIDDKE